MKTRNTKLNPAATLLKILLLLAMSWSLQPGEARGQTIPPLVNYQGRLSNPDGSPLPTADYMLTFNVFDAPTNGSLVWGPQIFDAQPAQGHGAKIPVVQGYFNVMLGPSDTTSRSLSDAFNASNRFVEITVSNRAPIAPRQQILTTPFAFQAANAAKLAGYDWSAVFGTNDPSVGQISGGKIADGSISLAKMAPRQVGTNVGIGGIALSAPCTSFSAASLTDVQVPNLSLVLACTGRPVFIALISDSAISSSTIDGAGNSAQAGGWVSVYRNGTPFYETKFGTFITGSSAHFYLPPGAFTFVDSTASVGTNTYTIRARSSGGGSSVDFVGVKLVAFEL